jgi:pimeloyl-ACP methyl ester carboxylesterase
MRGLIIFCHEYGSDMYSCMRYCGGLLEAGFDVFTFDFRSHGRSYHLPGYKARLWCTDKEVSDCLGALALVQATLEDRGLDKRIGLFGISRGAGAAILAAKHPHAPASIGAIIADSPFSTDTTLELSMKKWVHIFARVRFVYEHHPAVFWRFLRWMLLKFARVRFKCSFPSVRKALAKANVPIFIIHGKKDSYIRVEQAEMLFGLGHRPRYLWVVGEAKHNQSAVAEPERYAARTVRFFEKYVAVDGRSRIEAADEHGRDAVEFFGPAENVCRPGTDQAEELRDAKQDTGSSRGRKRAISIQSVQQETGPLQRRSGRGAVGSGSGQSGQ